MLLILHCKLPLENSKTLFMSLGGWVGWGGAITFNRLQTLSAEFKDALDVTLKPFFQKIPTRSWCHVGEGVFCFLFFFFFVAVGYDLLTYIYIYIYIIIMIIIINLLLLLSFLSSHEYHEVTDIRQTLGVSFSGISYVEYLKEMSSIGSWRQWCLSKCRRCSEENVLAGSLALEKGVHTCGKGEQSKLECWNLHADQTFEVGKTFGAQQ